MQYAKNIMRIKCPECGEYISLHRYTNPQRMRVSTIHLTNWHFIQLDTAVETGEFPSRSEAIRTIIHRYFKKEGGRER